MKHDTQELLLAEAVRQRVAEIREAKTREMTDQEEKAFRGLPVDDFIEQALKDLNAIATVISRLRES